MLAHLPQRRCSIGSQHQHVSHTFITPIMYHRSSTVSQTLPAMRQGGVPRALPDNKDVLKSAPGLTEDEVPWELQASNVPQPAEPTLTYDTVTVAATLGLLETAYLTYVKLFNAPLACPTSGCFSVLTSPYSELFGIPLSAFGMVAYGSAGLLAVSCAQQARAGMALEARRPAAVGLAGGVALLSSCSAFLIYILQTQFAGSPCTWCYLSAGISFSMALALLYGMPARQLQAAAMPSGGVVLATVALLYGGMFVIGPQQVNADEDYQLEYRAPVVTTSSTDQSVRLASRLKAAGAKMYGAFWCSHCFDQKQIFGSAAMANFPYVECYPNGWKKGQPIEPVCDAAGVRAFPTWVIGGKNIEGELELEQVEEELTRIEAAAAKTR